MQLCSDRELIPQVRLVPDIWKAAECKSCEIRMFVCVCVLAASVRQEMLEDSQNKLVNLLNSTEGRVDK